MEGQLSGGVIEKLQKWIEYFEEVLNGDHEIQNIDIEQRFDCQEVDHENILSAEEILEIINSFKENKSAGENGIIAEILKEGGKCPQDHVCSLKEIW